MRYSNERMSIRPLSKALQLIAEKELNEVPSRILEDVNTVKKWLVTQPHLNARSDDQFLLTFLRASKFSLERTKQKLDTFYKMRTVASEFFANRDPSIPELQHYLKNGVIVIAPIKDGDPLRTIVRLGASDPDIFSFDGLIKLYFMLLDILLDETDYCQIAGLNVTVDYRDVTLKHILTVTPNAMKKAMTTVQDAYPIRLKSIVLIYMPSMAVTIHKLIKTFLSKKMADRSRKTIAISVIITILSVGGLTLSLKSSRSAMCPQLLTVHFNEYFSRQNNNLHGYVDDGSGALYDHIPISVLPIEYGGQGGSISELTAQWNVKVEEYKDWFINDEKFFSDETKRIQNSEKSENLFGVDGSFRKLDID